MPVPDYQSLMSPVLRCVAAGGEWTIPELRARVADDEGLSNEDRAATLPRGQSVFGSRCSWAVTYLFAAGLLGRPRRGVYVVTPRGRHALEEHPTRVDNDVLGRCDEFTEFLARTRDARPGKVRSAPASAVASGAESALADDTPHETIASAVLVANEALANDLLARVQASPPAFLERLVLRVLTGMGYGGANGAAEHLGRSGDEGLDGVIRQDILGLDRIYVQAKRYSEDRAVGRPDIQAFIGALHGAQADRGIFITTSRFTTDAVEYADRVASRVVLIEGRELARLMVQYNVGAQEDEIYIVKRIDEDFFDEA